MSEALKIRETCENSLKINAVDSVSLLSVISLSVIVSHHFFEVILLL